MKKYAILLFLIVANSLLDSCATDDLFDFKLELTSADNFSMATYRHLQEGAAIAANEFAIYLDGSSTILTTAGPSFGGNLMAEAAYEILDKVKNISITSNADLSPSYPAGSELKELFYPQEIASHCLGTPDTSQDCVYDFLSYSYINSIEEAFNLQMAIGFVQRQDGARVFSLKSTDNITSDSCTFTIRFDFDSGKSRTLTTAPVTLN